MVGLDAAPSAAAEGGAAAGAAGGGAGAAGAIEASISGLDFGGRPLRLLAGGSDSTGRSCYAEVEK